MKSLFLLLFSLIPGVVFGASCCVSNTSVSNLMILPSQWQETFTISQSNIIGDVNEKGTSTFRRKNNRDVTQFARLDLAYAWSPRHQSGVSLKYQNRSREFHGQNASDSGWSDVGLSYAFQPVTLNRFWFFSTLNIPTSTSVYDSSTSLAVDARGTGTYQTSAGFFGIHNIKEWDFILSPEIHYSFARTFQNSHSRTELGHFWGTSVSMGAGYIPWRSKARYGVGLTPRFDEGKEVVTNGKRVQGKNSLVWDTSLNFTYTFNVEWAMGLNYVDQTIFGPAQNTLLARSASLLIQKKWP